jgi:DNA replication protein DnaC
MSAFLKIDQCHTCQRSSPWEWTPAILLNGKALAGTGVWRSVLIHGRCSACFVAEESKRQEERRKQGRRYELLKLLGGERPYRELAFEQYRVTPENQLAFERANQFNPGLDNLYLWGPCGVGKTHLAWAIARRAFEETLSVRIQPAAQLSRKVRMKGPDEEQAALDDFISTEVLIIDDVGSGSDTAFHRQVLQEILDGRTSKDRAGLVITSKYSLDALASKLGDDAIPSRIAGSCQRVEIRGHDFRITMRKEAT